MEVATAALGPGPAPPPVGDLGEIHNNLTPESIRAFIIGKTGPLKVRQAEKKEFGEVFTPLGLINEMLDKLPVDVWTNKDYKWLDPAAGIGNFPMVVYERLMRGLEPVIPDPSERSDHIIRKMLYMAEYNQASCGNIERTFGTAANLFCGDFIKDKVRFKDPTISTFDVIVGNPPYNAPQKSQGKPGGGSTLWNLFVDESLNGRLNPGGYMTFVHPSGWRKPPSACSGIRHMFDIMVHQNYMRYLKIHSKCDGARIFGAQTRFDFYVIERRPPNPGELTTVVDQTGVEAELNLRTWVSFLPNHSFGLISSLLAGTEQNYVIFSRSQYGTDKKNESFVKSSRTVTHPYPLIHSIVSNGPKIYGTNVIKTSPHMFDISKIIIAESGIRNGVIFDRRGKYGMTQGAFGLRIPDPVGVEGPLMKKALESELFAQIVDAMSFGNFRVDMNMFRYFRSDFYKDPPFQESPQITSVSKYTECDGGEGEGEGEDEDECKDECEGGGGGAAMPALMKFTQTRTARPDPSKRGGRTRRRRRHRTTIKLRKYKKQRHTRKKHRLQ